jgi:hypothetical protein
MYRARATLQISRTAFDIMLPSQKCHRWKHLEGGVKSHGRGKSHWKARKQMDVNVHNAVSPANVYPRDISFGLLAIRQIRKETERIANPVAQTYSWLNIQINRDTIWRLAGETDRSWYASPNRTATSVTVVSPNPKSCLLIVSDRVGHFLTANHRDTYSCEQSADIVPAKRTVHFGSKEYADDIC